MISSWNDLICRNNVSNRMNMKLYTGGGTVIIRGTPLFLMPLL